MNVGEIKQAFRNGWNGIYSIIKKLLSQIKNLQSQVSSLETKNQELEERLKKLVGEKSKSSRNSSRPPSADGLKKKTKSLRKKSERKSGGQKGHEGSTLEMTDAPDEIIKIKLHHCKGCGRKISGRNKWTVSRQIIDLDIKKKVVEYRAECAVCSACGRESAAAFPDFCSKKVQYSPKVRALSVYLNKYQLIPLKRVAEIFSDLHGIKISEGSIVNFSAQLFDELEIFERECRDALLQSELIHADESGGRCEKKLQWFQVVSNKVITFIAFHHKRGTEAMNDIGILPNFKGKTVHDFYRSYFTFDVQHILCNAHLLRELIFEYEQNLQKWAGRMIQLLVEIKETVDRENEKGTRNSLSPYMIKKYEAEFESILKSGFRQNPYQCREQGKRGRTKQTSSRNLLDRLKEHRMSYLGFMNDFNVPFDNNLAERDIRMLKLYMKISGCFRSLSGAAYFCRIRSYISTARKNNLNTFDSIFNAFLGNPFSPKFAE